jgi:hypothetical protein
MRRARVLYNVKRLLRSENLLQDDSGSYAVLGCARVQIIGNPSDRRESLMYENVRCASETLKRD